MYSQKEEIAVDFGDSEAVVSILSRTNELAVLPHVVFKVLELSGSTDSAASEMENSIMVDPAFSAKLLTHANSAFYARERKVTSIRDAILYLGYKAVRSMALTIGVFDMFLGKNDKESLRRRAWWRHSVDTALSCRFLAESTRRLDPAEAYTCGLLHYIGKTLLDRFGGRDYGLVEALVAAGLPSNTAESKVYGCDHEELGVGAGKKWGLPASVVASFHYSEAPVDLNELGKYAACVALGSMIASRAVDGGYAAEQLPQWALAELEIPLSCAQETCDGAWARIASAASSMQF